MRKAKLSFDNIEDKRSAFHKSKHPIDLNKVDIKKILTTNKFSYSKKGFKYFIHYQNGNKIKSLCIKLSSMSGCDKYFDEIKHNYFLTKDIELLKAYKKTWERVSN